MARPRIGPLEHGYARCGKCGHKLFLKDYAPLQIAACPRCGDPQFIPMKIRDYWLYQPLGGGGMGSVYKATQAKDGKDYAVKVLPRVGIGRSELVEALLREGKIGMTLGRHDNLVAVTDYGEYNGEYYLASEFVEGIRLDILIEDQGEMTESDAICCALQILSAEKHIVRKGFFYRDLKPQNVIVQDDGSVRVLDYGLCLPIEEASKPDVYGGRLEGSPFYMPPERVSESPEGEFSEIYSLGLLLYLMLTGQNYFKKAELRKLIYKHVAATRVSTVAPNLAYCRPETARVLDKMIAREPSARYQTLAALEEDLEDIADRLNAPPDRALQAELPFLMEFSASPERRFFRLGTIFKWLIIALSLSAIVAATYLLVSSDPFATRLKTMIFERLIGT